MPYCPSCRTEVSETARFCTACGADLKADRVVEAPPQPSLATKQYSSKGSTGWHNAKTYGGAKNVSVVLKVLAWLILIFGLIGTIWVAVEVGGYYQSTAVDVISVILTFGLIVLVYGLALFAIAYVIDILVDIAHNTNDTVDVLIKKLRE